MYTYNGKNVMGLAGFTNHIAVWFFKGVFLKDEAKVLVNANEGTTKGLRQWRFTTISEIDERLLLRYINEAIAIEEAGFTIAPAKKETIIPDFLQLRLEADATLRNAFDALAPYKQREFCEYIMEAKQEKTKHSRFDKIKILIIEGKGLNDNYRK